MDPLHHARLWWAPAACVASCYAATRLFAVQSDWSHLLGTAVLPCAALAFRAHGDTDTGAVSRMSAACAAFCVTWLARYVLGLIVHHEGPPVPPIGALPWLLGLVSAAAGTASLVLGTPGLGDAP